MIPQLNQCAPAWASSRLPTPAPGVCPRRRPWHQDHPSRSPRSSSFSGSWVLGGAVVFRIHLLPHSGGSARGGSVGPGSRGAVVFRIHLPPHSGHSAWGGSVGIGAPPPGFLPKPGLPTVAQPRGLSWVSPSGLTAPAGLSWEPFQETGPAVGPGDGDRTVSVQGSGGLGSECHGVAEPPHPTVVHPFNSWHNRQQVGAYSVPQEQCRRVGAFLGTELPPEVPCENRTSDRGRTWDLSRGPDQKNQQKCTSRDAAWLAD